jgi:hypothetical protein
MHMGRKKRAGVILPAPSMVDSTLVRRVTVGTGLSVPGEVFASELVVN